MLLYFDLDTSAFVTGAGTRDPLSTLTVKRGDTCSIAIQFVSGAVAQELAAGASGVLGLKSAGDYDGDFIAAAASWTKTGTGTATLYTFDLNLATTEINALLSGDTASVAALLEMEFLVGSVRTSSQTLAITIYNDVIKGDETGPTDMTVGIPVNSEISFSGTFTFNGSTPGTLPSMLSSDADASHMNFDPVGISGFSTDYVKWYLYMGGMKWVVYKDDTPVFYAEAEVAAPHLVPGGPWNAVTNPGAWQPISPATGLPVVALSQAPTSGRAGSLRVSPGRLYICTAAPAGLAHWERSDLLFLAAE